MLSNADAVTRLDWAAIGEAPTGTADSVSVRSIQVEHPGPNEVRVRLRASGICHTDLDGLRFMPGPHIMGHEGAGVVTALGERVTDLRVGQPVLLTWAIACGRCPQCARGNPVLCETLGIRNGHAHPHATRNEFGAPLERFFALGTMSTATVVRREAVISLPDDIPFTSACLLGCAVMTGFGSVANAARVEPGAAVVVIGCGGVGLNVVQAARIAGASAVIAVDIDPDRERGARAFGATHFIQSERDDEDLTRAAALVRDILQSSGSDYAFECTAVPELAASPLSFVRNAGTAIQVSGVEKRVPINMELFEWDKTYLNPLYGKCRPLIDFPKLFDLYRSGQLLLDELVTRTYDLTDVIPALNDLKAGRNLKGVICFD